MINIDQLRYDYEQLFTNLMNGVEMKISSSNYFSRQFICVATNMTCFKTGFSIVLLNSLNYSSTIHTTLYYNKNIIKSKLDFFNEKQLSDYLIERMNKIYCIKIDSIEPLY